MSQLETLSFILGDKESRKSDFRLGIEEMCYFRFNVRVSLQERISWRHGYALYLPQ